MIKIQIFQHVPFETAGYFESLPKSHYQIATTHLYRGDQFPETSGYDLLVILGGPMNVDEHEKYKWLADEKLYIKKAVTDGKKIIGICLGAQLIASALGATVRKNKSKEIGWFAVNKTESGQNSKLLSDIPDTFDALHWHGDTFSIPDGALHTAKSDCCMNQMFIYNNRVIGLQFHLEATVASLQQLIDNCRNELIASTFVQTESAIIERANELIPRTNKYLGSLIRNLIEV